jgi:hypothetical protein
MQDDLFPAKEDASKDERNPDWLQVVESNECGQQKVESLSSPLHSWTFGKVFHDFLFLFYAISNDGGVIFA